jgi:hypothetical protein
LDINEECISEFVDIEAEELSNEALIWLRRK